LSLAGWGVWRAVYSSRESAPSVAETRDADLTSEPAPTGTLDEQFTTTVHPFFKRFCFECHGQEKQEASLNLEHDLNLTAIATNTRQWDLVLERLRNEEMPPEDALSHPTRDERAAITTSMRNLRTELAERNAGDPGTVLARRLSNAEFDYTIRDLTGVDIRPTREFPVDPANEAGFDNSGESLVMSPALLKKYLAAARLVADHVILEPEG